MTEDEKLLLLELLKNCISEEDYDFNMISLVDATLSDYFDDGLLDENGRISLAYENLVRIPRQIADKFGSQTRSLDLSYNNFRDFSFLSSFSQLHTLILDRNENPDDSTFPYLPNLEILWMNNCKIRNISKWIYKIQRQCPNIRYLSLLGNPGARCLFSGATSTEECEYRLFVSNTLPTLVYLDDSAIQTNPSYVLNKSTKCENSERMKKSKLVLLKHLQELKDIYQSSSTT